MSPNGRRSVSNAGTTVMGVRQVLNTLESAFKVIANTKPRMENGAGERAYGASQKGATLLEEALEEALGQLVDTVKKDPQEPSRAKKKELDFDSMFERLVAFRQEFGHTNVPNKYKRDKQLGSWVANLRTKRKTLDKKDEDFEIEADLEEDGDDTTTTPNKRRRGRQSRLTPERINMLDSIGFNWTVELNNKSWEERLQDLIQYQEIHGNTHVPRSMGSLGEWVHHQRKLYNRRDVNFITKRA